MKNIIEEEYGKPYDLMQSGVDFLIGKAKSNGLSASIKAEFRVQGVTRFANSQITQHSEISTISFNLRLIDGKKTATVSTTRIDDSGLEKLYSQAEIGVRATPEIPFYQGLVDPQPANPVNLKGYNWTIEERAESIVSAVNGAEEVDASVKLAGVSQEEKVYQKLVSTNGLDVEDGFSTNFFKVNAIIGKTDYRGYGQEQTFWRYDQPNYGLLAKTATKTARDTKKLITKPPGEYEVVLGAQAFSNIFLFAQFTSDPVSFNEGNSYISDKLGAQIFDEKISVVDSPRDPRMSNFVYNVDIDGVPSKNRAFFENGVLKFVPYSSFWAAKYMGDKNASTGHAVADNSTFPVSCVFKPGNKTLEEQISEIDDGLFVKSFWYNRITIKREGGLTGLTRNGLFYVKNGEIQGAVRNLRYTESFVRALEPGNVNSLSKDLEVTHLTTVPSIHLKRYRFSSVAHTDPSEYLNV